MDAEAVASHEVVRYKSCLTEKVFRGDLKNEAEMLDEEFKREFCKKMNYTLLQAFQFPVFRLSEAQNSC